MGQEKIREHERILRKIVQHDIKAIFCDEFDMTRSESIKKMMKIAGFLWIVPWTNDLQLGDFRKWENEFTFLDLSQNFRNSREIVKTTKSFAEWEYYRYKEGIVMPPENFPTGCPPIFVDSLEDAMKEARKRTKDGILIINRHVNDADKNYLNQTREKWKMYGNYQNDFRENENPYKFLQEGNVLIVECHFTNGFQWSTVIVIEKGTGSIGASLNECNWMMRCTTNLIVVRKRRNTIRPNWT